MLSPCVAGPSEDFSRERFFPYYWGSSQSRESDERIEAKLDALLRERRLDPEDP